ncbi:MAG: hypothetical protein JSW02_07380 [candidate division WOR-3 bacterium]|nr:MAG: hypothetical protein JSW02_07380 [candidate division WOR-3 bacterium]
MNNTGPSRWFYGLAVIIALAGSAVFIVFLLGSLGGLTKGLQQIVVPGNYEMMFDKTGTYLVYYEYESVVDGRVFSTGEIISDMQCAVNHKESGRSVRIGPVSASSTYTMGSRAGKAILQFRIDEPGLYEFSAWYDNGGQDIVLAVGQDFTMGLFVSIFGGIAVLFGSWIIACIIFIITLVRRKKAGRVMPAGGS